MGKQIYPANREHEFPNGVVVYYCNTPENKWQVNRVDLGSHLEGRLFQDAILVTATLNPDEELLQEFESEKMLAGFRVFA